MYMRVQQSNTAIQTAVPDESSIKSVSMTTPAMLHLFPAMAPSPFREWV
jgi:hypothetical protein